MLRAPVKGTTNFLKFYLWAVLDIQMIENKFAQAKEISMKLKLLIIYKYDFLKYVSIFLKFSNQSLNLL